MENKDLGTQIAYWRKKRKLTQEQLAVKIGVSSKVTVSAYETGLRIPSSLMLGKIAEALHCKVSVRLSGK